MFAIAKRSHMGDGAIYVTAIRQGGRLINNRYVSDHERGGPWMARKWKNKATADAAQRQLAEVGGYDDYIVVTL